MGNPTQSLSKRPFLAVWTLAVVAATAAFALHLGIRVEGIQLGYELGRAHSELSRLREVRRVLELEVASHKTPERIDFVARTLLGMDAPSKDRIFTAGPMPNLDEAEGTDQLNLARGAGPEAPQEAP
jgi:cell division protein FtsL